MYLQNIFRDVTSVRLCKRPLFSRYGFVRLMVFRGFSALVKSAGSVDLKTGVQ